MKNKKFIVIALVIILILVIVFGLFIFNNEKKNENLENKENLELSGEEYAPSKVYDENNTEVKLSDYSDKPMALIFFNTSDINSHEVIEIVEKNYEEYKSAINFVNISVIDGVTETKEKVESYVKNNNITIPVLYDTDYTAKNEYKIDKIPTLVFINKNNEIINTISDDINEDVIQANLDILSENY